MTAADLYRELMIQTRWIIGAMIALQVPTWIGMILTLEYACR